MNKNIKQLIIILVSFFTIILAIGIGSVYIAPLDTINIILYKLFNFKIFNNIDDIQVSILWKIRFPRVVLAFVSGAGLSISGVIMQSVLKNPLASSYTLGVSSGAVVGASLTFLLKINILGIFTMPFFGFLGGILTVFLALTITYKIDKNMQNNSIILLGMVLSLFANALISIIISFSKKDMESLIAWQMGSFVVKNTLYILILIPILLIVSFIVFIFYKEMNIMTFGDEQAKFLGVCVKKIKWILLVCASILTGAIVSVTGVIGFIDLFTPHIVRKLFGANHKYVLPMSAILGGTFMVVCDLVARTIVAPIELPVGAVTAFIGAPFFIYLYFSKRKDKYD